MKLKLNDIKTFEKLEKTFFEKECFHNTSFIGIKSKNYPEPLRFLRTDFRGALFAECEFNNADFYRSDFISCDVSKSKFEHCSFKTSALINSSFSNCFFSRNINMTPDVIRCYFFETDFIKQKFFRSVWRESYFKKCTFDKFSIDRSTIEEITFDECIISNLNLSRLIAQDITFIKTTLDNVVFDLDYVGSYLFDKFSLNNKISLMYKDELIDLRLDNLDRVKELAKYFFKNLRFSDAFGIAAICSLYMEYREHTLIDFWIECLKESLKVKNQNDAQQHINRLVKMYLFYLDAKTFTLGDSIKVLNVVSNILPAIQDIKNYEKVYYLEALLERKFKEGNYSIEDITDDKNLNQPVIARLTFQTDDKEQVIDFIDNFMRQITNNRDNQYKIIKIIFGSIWVDIITSLAAFLIMARFAKSIMGETFSIIITYKMNSSKLLLTNQLLEYISNNDKVNIKQLAEKADIIDKLNNITTCQSKNDILLSLKEMNIDISDTLKRVS